MNSVGWSGGSIAETANGGYRDVAAVSDRKNSAIVSVRGCCAGVLGDHKNR